MKSDAQKHKKAEHAPVSPFSEVPAAGAPSGQSSAAAGAKGDNAPSAAAGIPSPEMRTVSVPAFGQGDDDLSATLDHARTILDSRIVSCTVLVLLLLLIVHISNFIMFAVLLFVGYVLADRFVAVRRCITLGGTAWLVVLLLGNVLMAHLGRVPLTIDYLFMFCGFLLALAVCGAFFAGRSMYYYGFGCGQAEADSRIAKHVVDRLVEHPDDWDNLDGNYLEVESALNRVRDRERASAQAVRDESRRKDDLVTYLAHDLKTPLASVVGYLSLLEEAPDLPEEQRVRFTGVALEKAHRLDALIEEFFDITRFDFHDIVLTRGYVDLDLMLAQVADEFYPQLTAQGKTAEIDVPMGLTVLVDGDKMARVFNNVMKNAIAYSYEGSVIRVSAERVPGEGDSKGSVSIRFENQGDPIPAPKLKLIFEKFYRLDAARATNHGGAGLGLAIAKEIVVAHGGQISCTSTPEHTVFTIVLPL